MFVPESAAKLRLAKVLSKTRVATLKQQPQDKDIRISTEVLSALLEVPLLDLTLDDKGNKVRLGIHFLGRFLSESDVQLDGVYAISTTLHTIIKVYNTLFGLQPIEQHKLDLLYKFNNMHCSVYRYRPPGFKFRIVTSEELITYVEIKAFNSFRKKVLSAGYGTEMKYRTNMAGHFYTDEGRVIGAPARPLAGSFKSKSFAGCAIYWKEEFSR
jgi:hypothetical protein